MTPKMKKILGVFSKTIKQLETHIEQQQLSVELSNSEIAYLTNKKKSAQSEIEQATNIKNKIEGIIS